MLPFVVLALAIVWLTMMLGGTGPVDFMILQSLYVADRPGLRSAASLFTILGEWRTVLFVSLAAAGWLLWTGHRRTAFLFLGITLAGRTLVEAQKFGVHRLRPDDLEHLVPVKSLSFPSAHAANSMMLWLTLALLTAPPRWRAPAMVAALTVAFLVGLTRPMLGVHWPSDVVGGWAFGAAWVLAMVSLAERRVPGADKPKISAETS